MVRTAIFNKRLVGLFLAGCLLLNYPLLALFSRPITAWGIPLLFGYIFGVWIILIVCVQVIVRPGKTHVRE
jgi:hypothetical protein